MKPFSSEISKQRAMRAGSVKRGSGTGQGLGLISSIAEGNSDP
jgi:hypothetical protein